VGAEVQNLGLDAVSGAALGELKDNLLDPATRRLREIGFEEVQNFGHQGSLTKR
jgi:hypothetical protein